MHDHPDIDDDELLSRFAADTLPGFPHEEHLHVVFVHAARHPTEATLTFVRDGIRKMAAANGAPEKYHETRTAAWVRLVAAARSGFSGTFGEFLEAHPELLRRDLLGEFYSAALLNGDDARQRFTAPDLRELPR